MATITFDYRGTTVNGLTHTADFFAQLDPRYVSEADRVGSDVTGKTVRYTILQDGPDDISFTSRQWERY